MSAVVLNPGSVPLETWRKVYNGAVARLDPASAPLIKASADAVDAIVAKGEPIYGINTGFGKLASVRIEKADLAKLQYNIVLSHAAGVGEPLSGPAARDLALLRANALLKGYPGVRPLIV